MTSPEHDPSITHEPQFQQGELRLDPSEAKGAEQIRRESTRATEHDLVEHSVWDEVAHSRQLAGDAPDGQLTYARWLERNQARTSWAKSWLITLGIAAIAGPFGIAGALWSPADLGTASQLQWIGLAVIAPVTEEITKVAAALWVVEKRPFWFKSIGQILICAVAGGAMFGVIENFLYLYLLFPNHSPPLADWRWSVCIGLHMNCSLVAGVGLARIWHNAIREQHRPILGLGLPWFFIAMAGHGLYNFSVAVAETAGWLDFLR